MSIALHAGEWRAYQGVSKLRKFREREREREGRREKPKFRRIIMLMLHLNCLTMALKREDGSNRSARRTKYFQQDF